MENGEVTVTVETPEAEATPAAAPVTIIQTETPATDSGTVDLAVTVGSLVTKVEQLTQEVSSLKWKAEDALAIAQNLNTSPVVDEPVAEIEEIAAAPVVVEVVPESPKKRGWLLDLIV